MDLKRMKKKLCLDYGNKKRDDRLDLLGEEVVSFPGVDS